MGLFKLKEPLDVNGNTPLMNSLLKGDAESAKALIKRGANVNHRGFVGESPLHIAAGNGYISLVRILLESGARVNERDDGGETPLFKSANSGHPEIVKLLLEKGADITVRNQYEQDALHKTFQFFNRKGEGNARCADILLEAGSEPNPIHFAPTQLLWKLVKYGADINMLIVFGKESRLMRSETPLISACRDTTTVDTKYGLRVIELLDLGANPYIENSKGLNAFEVAANNSSSLLRDLGTEILNADKAQRKRIGDELTSSAEAAKEYYAKLEADRARWKAEYEASRPRCQKCGGTLSRGESIHRLESQVRGWTRCNGCGDLIILFSRPIGDGDIVS